MLNSFLHLGCNFAVEGWVSVKYLELAAVVVRDEEEGWEIVFFRDF